MTAAHLRIRIDNVLAAIKVALDQGDLRNAYLFSLRLQDLIQVLEEKKEKRG